MQNIGYLNLLLHVIELYYLQKMNHIKSEHLKRL